MKQNGGVDIVWGEGVCVCVGGGGGVCGVLPAYVYISGVPSGGVPSEGTQSVNTQI